MVQEDDGSVRIEVLQRLAEQAMSDPTFRYGYDLWPQELALVLRFRRSLADAGVDLDLVSSMGEAQLMAIFEGLPRRVRQAGGR